MMTYVILVVVPMIIVHSFTHVFTVVFDLDDTLTMRSATKDAALPPVPATATPADWEEWNALCAHDRVRIPFMLLYWVLLVLGFEMIIMSARGVATEDITRRWLRRRGLFNHQLILRPEYLEGEPSAYYKAVMLHTTGITPVLAVDDSHSNITMFKERGAVFTITA